MEIITLQFGNFSNFVGTHYWNEQYRHTVSANSFERNDATADVFRDNLNAPLRPYPRVVCFDVKSSLRTLREDGTFREEQPVSEERSSGDKDEYELYEQPKYEKNEFQRAVINDPTAMPVDEIMSLDDTVKTWSDYMLYDMNENSVQLLSSNYNDAKDFAFFGVGREEFRNIEDEVEDKLHYWVEECNALQGFQTLTDLSSGGFCGLSVRVLEELCDEYNKKCRLSFLNYQPDDNKDKTSFADVNLALTLQAYNAYADLNVVQSLYVGTQQPVNISGVECKPHLKYHTSAILAATIDTSSLSWRRKSMREFSDFITSSGVHKFAGSAFGVPFLRDRNNTNLVELLASKNTFYDNDVMSNLCSFHAEQHEAPFTQVITARDLPVENTIPSRIDQHLLQKLGLNSNVFTPHPSSVLDYFSARFYPSCISHSCFAKQKLFTSTPFPHIFPNHDRVSAMTSIMTSPAFYNTVRGEITKLSKLNLNKQHHLQEFDLDLDTFNELKEDLENLAHSYDPSKKLTDFNFD